MQVVENKQQDSIVITMDGEELRELHSNLMTSIRWYASAEDGSTYPKDRYSLYRLLQFLEELEGSE